MLQKAIKIFEIDIKYIGILNGIYYVVSILLSYGAGYNTVVQIYFQNETCRDDIPVLKGIYNIVCGISILLSGFLTPLLVADINVFFVAMSLLFIFSIIYLFVLT